MMVRDAEHPPEGATGEEWRTVVLATSCVHAALEFAAQRGESTADMVVLGGVHAIARFAAGAPPDVRDALVRSIAEMLPQLVDNYAAAEALHDTKGAA